jgi:hypothetical protein
MTNKANLHLLEKGWRLLRPPSRGLWNRQNAPMPCKILSRLSNTTPPHLSSCMSCLFDAFDAPGHLGLLLRTDKHGDASPACVDVYFAYGKALLENAIAQNSVLGKEETSAALQGDDETKGTFEAQCSRHILLS